MLSLFINWNSTIDIVFINFENEFDILDRESLLILIICHNRIKQNIVNVILSHDAHGHGNNHLSHDCTHLLEMGTFMKK